MKLNEIALGSKEHHELVAKANRKKTTITVGEFKKTIADSTMPMMDTTKLDDALDGVKDSKVMTRSDVEQICAIADVDLGEVLDIIALREGVINEFARSSGDDEDTGDWKKISFKGESVYYKVSLVSFQQRNHGLQVQIALRPNAVNAESEFARNEKINTYGKTRATVDDDAIKLVFKYLNQHGTEELAKAMKSWGAESDAYEKSRATKLSKATKTNKLPAGHTIVDGPKKGIKFVKTPDGKLIPNQGVNAYETEQDLIDNFYAWKSLNEAKGTDTAVKGKKFIVIGNPGNNRASALYPKTDAPKLYTESEAKRICAKLNDKPFGGPAPVAHWHYKGLDVALDFVLGSAAVSAIRKLVV